MTDHYLRATDERAMNAALASSNVLDEHGNQVPGVDLVIIGTIVNDGIPVPGFHANLRTTVELDVKQLEKLPLIDKPKNPVCAWFDLP